MNHKLIMENWRGYLNEETYLNEELLDEGLRDWLKAKSTSAIESIKSSLAKVGQEIKESGEAGKLILKAAKGTALSETITRHRSGSSFASTLYTPRWRTCNWRTCKIRQIF